MIDLDQLEAMAKAATPGPWRTGECGNVDCWCRLVLAPSASDEENCVVPSGSIEARDAAFVSAANPAVVLELITQIRELQRICQESYVVVGFLSNSIGQIDFDQIERALANLEQCRIVHENVLPFGWDANGTPYDRSRTD